MFYGKRIKELEGRVDVLEAKVAELTRIVDKYCQEVDFLMAEHNKTTPVINPKPQPRRRPRRKNGKETPKATE